MCSWNAQIISPSTLPRTTSGIHRSGRIANPMYALCSALQSSRPAISPFGLDVPLAPCLQCINDLIDDGFRRKKAFCQLFASGTDATVFG